MPKNGSGLPTRREKKTKTFKLLTLMKQKMLKSENCSIYLHVYIFCFSFDIAYKKDQQGKKDQKKKDKESANQSKGDDENDVETIEDDDDDNAMQQEGGGTGGPGVGHGGATNGDVDSVVEISDSSDN